MRKYSYIHPRILIDGIFFQLNPATGIARVWKNLLKEWSKTPFARHILLLDRNGTAPSFQHIRKRIIPCFDYKTYLDDRMNLEKICREENADLFISTYYTIPNKTPSLFFAYDMIPEMTGDDLSSLVWILKHEAMRHSSYYLAISDNTAKDILRFFPHLNSKIVQAIPCGVDHEEFYPDNPKSREQFRNKYKLRKPYSLFIGGRYGYKNGKLFFKALSLLPKPRNMEAVCVGGLSELEPEFKKFKRQFPIHLLKLGNEELRAAYSGAQCLVYPSKYEGFGLPILEAMSCGCPVITTRTSSIPEVAKDAAFYVDTSDPLDLKKALLKIQNHEIRSCFIQKGYERAKQYSWTKMADEVRDAILNTCRQLRNHILPARHRPVSYHDYKHSALLKQYRLAYRQNPPLSPAVEDAIKYSPNPYFLLYLGEQYLSSDQEKAKIYIQLGGKILKKRKNLNPLHAYRVLSLYKKSGLISKAEKGFKKLIGIIHDPNVLCGVYFHLGEIAFLHKDYLKSKQHLKKCVSLNPRHQKAKEYLFLFKNNDQIKGHP
ncbi:MAG: glycosyltransferase family 4 protein [Candidatus Aureabacteria bacterium]|nr:glycosyltransferase family 4 protein [Candidatus Auribacterota bacterium]